MIIFPLRQQIEIVEDRHDPKAAMSPNDFAHVFNRLDLGKRDTIPWRRPCESAIQKPKQYPPSMRDHHYSKSEAWDHTCITKTFNATFYFSGNLPTRPTDLAKSRVMRWHRPGVQVLLSWRGCATSAAQYLVCDNNDGTKST